MPKGAQECRGSASRSSPACRRASRCRGNARARRRCGDPRGSGAGRTRRSERRSPARESPLSSYSCVSRLSGPTPKPRLGISARAKHDVHLMRAQHVHDREQRADLHVRQRFLHRLARRGVLHRLAVLHESGRHGPEAAPRLDRALAEQDLAFHVDHAAGDDARILVVDGRRRPCRRSAAGDRRRESCSATGWPQAEQNFMRTRA